MHSAATGSAGTRAGYQAEEPIWNSLRPLQSNPKDKTVPVGGHATQLDDAQNR